ncbi:MAG: SGNH/GDSL hydrolase family protein [Deltaproteobacteria bacterium]|nr:SGNH/GDSL hydrolase family protein [Deltaproteobacteria bacterium]
MHNEPRKTPDAPSAAARQSACVATPDHAWIKRAAAVLFGVFAALIVFEIGFRIANSTLHTPSKWRDRPAVYYLPEASHNRDQLYSPAKSPGTFRIIVIGDSFTEPGENQYDDSFSKRLERMLNLNKEQPRVEVLNWGVPGSSTAQQALLVQRAVSNFNPDLVVLQITLNDPEFAPYRETHNLKNKGTQKEGLLAHWKSLAFLRSRIANSQSREAYVQYYQDLFDQSATWNHFSGAVQKIEKITSTANVPLLAVLFPLFSHPLDDSYPFKAIHQKVTGLLDMTGIKRIDLLSSYQNIPPERLQVRPGKDSHPNEIAHRIAADSIYTAMVDYSLIPVEIRAKHRTRNRYGKTQPKNGTKKDAHRAEVAQ